MAEQEIKNIVIFSMHRSGSTYLNTRIACGLGMYFGLTDLKDYTVRNLGEITGWASLLTEDAKPLRMHSEVKALAQGIDCVMPLRRLVIRRGNLRRRKGSSSVMQELESRERILRSGAWDNHAVMRIQPWQWRKMSDRIVDAALVPDAHYVVLWRRDLFAWMTSMFILRNTAKSHGTIVFDGNPFHKDVTVDTRVRWDSRYIDTFLNTVRKLSDRKDRVLVMETSQIDQIDTLEWPDGTTLVLPTKQALPEKGGISYVDADGNPVKKNDMISAASLDVIQQAADRLTQRYDWNNAVYDAVYK
jgi:hypothetical protein